MPDQPVLFALALGFALGLKHATEADHLVAVTTIVSEQRSLWRSSLVGALWGVGHTAALALAGLVIILLQVAISPRTGAMLEIIVAAMIVLLGLRVLYVVFKDHRRIHAHTHAHDGRAHLHLHFHDENDAHAPATAHAHDAAGHKFLRGWRPVLVGMVHGMAGAAALPLLVLSELMGGGSRALGLAYLVVFGIGSIAGMLLMSAVISLPFIFSAARFDRLLPAVRFVVGLASIAFGFYYAWEAVGELV